MLIWILYEVMARGISALNISFFLNLPQPIGMPGGGLANAIIGTVYITLLATVMGVPLGILAGIFLSEFGQQSRFASWVRFTANILMGVPSIIIGVFVYSFLVVTTGHFSGRHAANGTKCNSRIGSGTGFKPLADNHSNTISSSTFRVDYGGFACHSPCQRRNSTFIIYGIEQRLLARLIK